MKISECDIDVYEIRGLKDRNENRCLPLKPCNNKRKLRRMPLSKSIFKTT